MRKRAFQLLLLTAILTGPLGRLSARGIDCVTEALRATDDYAVRVDYRVTLPQSADDVVYEVILEQHGGGDRFAPCDYLVRWKYVSGETPTEGFSSYADGTHFRYRGSRLQEYHAEADSLSFLAGGKGVARTAQFVDLLPAMLAERFEALAADPAWEVTETATGLRARLAADGEAASTLELTLDPSTGKPRKLLIESNPGSISEQTVEAVYTPLQPERREIDEALLASLYPDAFERYRRSNFRLESLVGAEMPAYSLPGVAKARVERGRGQTAENALVIVALDPAHGSTPEVVSAVREGIGAAVAPVDIVWAVDTTNPEAAEQAVGEVQPGEILAFNIGSLRRDAGLSMLPSMIFIGRDGRVARVIVGTSPDLAEKVNKNATFASL